MTFDVQTKGDEAIYHKFPGTTTAPSPLSGRTLDIPAGYKELRYIKDKATGKILWAHKWKLTTSAGTGGTVTCSPSSSRVKDGQTITATATPNSSYKFSSWSDGDTTNPRTFTMKQHLSIVASFSVNKHTLTIVRRSTSGGTAPTVTETSVVGGGSYTSGTTVTPVATVNSGYTNNWAFVNFKTASGTVVTSVTMDADITLYADFVPRYSVTWSYYSGTTAKTSVTIVNYGTDYDTIEKPTDTTRTGYTLTGWGDPTPSTSINASGQVIGNCVSTAQYEEMYIYQSYLTHSNRILAGDTSAKVSFNLEKGKSYRFILDDIHLCYTSSTGTIIKDGLIIQMSQSSGSSVKWNDLDAPDRTNKITLIHNYEHAGGYDNSAWPRTQLISYSGYGDYNHWCSPPFQETFIGNGSEVEVGSGIRLGFESSIALDKDLTVTIKVNGSKGTSASSSVYFNARLTVREVSAS